CSARAAKRRQKETATARAPCWHTELSSRVRERTRRNGPGETPSGLSLLSARLISARPLRGRRGKMGASASPRDRNTQSKVSTPRCNVHLRERRGALHLQSKVQTHPVTNRFDIFMRSS